jgi:PleD family two-component response regulator
MGIASTIPDATGSEQDLILQADRALYQAKAQGRDCTVLAQL